LLQQGKGADMGAAFGAGASGTVFGARGSGSFFSRATGVIAALFFINSIVLSSPLVREEQDPTASVTSSVPAGSADEAPAADLPVGEVAPDEEVAEEPDIDLPPADIPDVPDVPADVPTDAAPPESDLPE
jgi:preprotein translocase subunit SecG